MNLSLDAGEVVGSPVGGKCLPPILPKSVHRHAEKAMNNNTRQQAGTVGEERQATGERRAEHSGHNLVKEASQRCVVNACLPWCRLQRALYIVCVYSLFSS